MPKGVHIPLTQRNNKNNTLFFLSALGKLFSNGVTFPVDMLYPKVEFPVSKGTSGISSLVRWDHSEDWFVTKYENMKTKSSGERLYKINLSSDNEEFMSGHVIDGKILIPATCYLQYVWETYSLMYHGPSYMDVPVEFEDVRFLRATNMSLNGNVELNVMIHYGTGQFEITESGSLVVTGSIHEIENPVIPKVYDFNNKSDFPMLSKKDFYKELRLRGYHYNGAFRAVNVARGDGLFGRVEWNYNWVTFMDAMLQIQILCTDSRTLLIPTKIRKLRIYGLHHFDLMTKMSSENRVFDVYVEPKYDRIVAGGIELIGLHASPVQRRKSPGIPVLEKYEFTPHFTTRAFSTTNAVRMCVQLALENSPSIKMKVVEIGANGYKPIISKFVEGLEDLPLVTGDFLFFTDQKNDEIPGVHIETAKFTNQTNCNFIIANNLSKENNYSLVNAAYKSLLENGYLISKEKAPLALESLKIFENFNLIADMALVSEERILLLQKVVKKLTLEPVVLKVSEEDIEFEWITQVQTALSNKTPVILYSFNESTNGLIGLVNCLRKEPEGSLITCFYIDDKSAPLFDLKDPFYNHQFVLGLAINVYHKGQWGSYRHLKLPCEFCPRPISGHIYGNVMQRGDLSTLRWLEGPLDINSCSVRIVFSSLNFRDVMLATGRLAVELYGSSRLDQLCVLGLEFSGINTKTGKRVMSMVAKAGVASFIERPSKFIWDVPDHWTLQEAATVPVVYITVYYAFFMTADIRKGKSILIHAGTGGIGLAAIRVALAYKLEVFTTCSTTQKKQFLLQTFPELKECHIGNSRDTSFEMMIQRETNGKGVDFVLNSLAEDKLLASVRCLGYGGHFLEIGKFDMSNDTKLGMSCFLKEITFHAVLADRLEFALDKEINYLKHIIDVDIEKGIIQPLPSTVFPAEDIEQAFRHLIGGKHIGKVLIKVREDPESLVTLPVRVLHQVYFKADLSYIIPGGLGGFGLELADWMAIRGARKIILSSRRGLSKDYQAYRIALWKTYGCEVIVSMFDICTIEGCIALLNQAKQYAPIGGIFNLAVVLRDGIFPNQTKEKFVESFAPKAIATKYLDQLTRSDCPHLEHFVVFSSVSCGRGNAGQTNYGMANSIMERIVEDRVKHGYPGKAIQWGAVGEVGLVADMAEDKIDMEIGGTLQQRISSCLCELDILLSVQEPIISSMVVAEKRVGRMGNESVLETVMNIMGIRDLKSVSLGTTLSEMGMDSLMAVEIKQTLERDFDLTLTPQDLRALTFQKLQEYADAREKESSDVKMIFTSDSNILGMEILLRNLGDESRCNEIMIPLKTAANTTKQSMPPNIIIPGLEGTAGQAWYNMGELINNRCYVLQLHKFADCSTVKEVAEACFDHVKAELKATEPFYIIGYSYGSFIALQLAAMLEKSGYRGQLLLIDGAPHFLKKLTLAHLGEDFTDSNLYNLLLSSIVKQIFPDEIQESVVLEFSKLDQLNDKMTRFMDYVNKQSLYSNEYADKMVHAMFRRISMAANYNLDTIDLLTTPIVLIRPAEVSLQDIEEDYCLSKITTGKVVLKVIEGNHTSMLDNPILPQIINEMDPALQEDRTFEEYIRNVKPVVPLV
ncbi:fatty acid synthase-like [Rhagoletis pomonella]|nr:fatty acid synthase-like [Rhagoletis pomonella]